MAVAFSAALTVGAAYPAQSAPDFDPKIEGCTHVSFRAVTGNFFYSFDGVSDHGMVNAADVNQPQIIPIRLPGTGKIWLKQNGGAATARVGVWTAPST